MALPDLLRLTELALSGNLNPQLPEDLLRLMLEETSARAGVLVCDDRIIARWPRNVGRRAGETGDGWIETCLSREGVRWTVQLHRPERMDELVLGSARLALRAWDLREELKRTRFDERFHLWELEAIRAIATSIGGILDRARLAEELINHLVALLGVRSAHLYLGERRDDAALVGGFGGPALLDEEAIERAWDNGLYSDDVVALLLKSDGGVLGLLVAGHKEARAGTEPFAANDVRLLELFAVQVTVALEYVRLTEDSLERERLKQELEVAAVIQSHLYPQEFQQLAGYRLAGRSSPSRHVAGDTYDVLVGDGSLLAAVTDVSGKGVGAGMLASGVHAGLRLLAEEELELAELASRLNRYLVGATADNRFATMAMLRCSVDGHVDAVNAGHCPVLVRRVGGSIEQISSSGLPLGILPDAAYAVETTRLDPGDLAVIYTDGLTEAENLEEEEFGVDRVAEVLVGLVEVTADEACERLLEAVDEFSGGRPLADDATLLVIERLA